MCAIGAAMHQLVALRVGICPSGFECATMLAVLGPGCSRHGRGRDFLLRVEGGEEVAEGLLFIESDADRFGEPLRRG